MLDFLLRKQLDSLLERAYRAAMVTYYNSLLNLLYTQGSCGLTDDILAQKTCLLREDALQQVSDFVYGVIQASPPNIFLRYKLAKAHPAICGVPHEASYCAGAEYCFLHYAFTGKPGSAKNATKHNHLFAAYVDQALSKADSLDQK